MKETTKRKKLFPVVLLHQTAHQSLKSEEICLKQKTKQNEKRLTFPNN